LFPPPAGQLLGLTIAAEEPQLEAQRAGLMQQQEALALEVAGLEKQLLESLASST
jgi:dynein heavy chain 2